MTPSPAGLRALNAAEIAARFELTPPSREIAASSASAEECFERLAASPAPADAVIFLAGALPPRELVGWGCLCIRKVGAPAPASPALAALESAERWVAASDDRNRRAAFDAAQTAGLDSPAALVASAVLFTGGSISPEGMDPAPPPPGAAAKMIAGAIQLCAANGDPQSVPERYESCLALGRRVAQRLATK